MGGGEQEIRGLTRDAWRGLSLLHLPTSPPVIVVGVVIGDVGRQLLWPVNVAGVATLEILVFSCAHAPLFVSSELIDIVFLLLSFPLLTVVLLVAFLLLLLFVAFFLLFVLPSRSSCLLVSYYYFGCFLAN